MLFWWFLLGVSLANESWVELGWFYMKMVKFRHHLRQRNEGDEIDAEKKWKIESTRLLKIYTKLRTESYLFEQRIKKI